MSSIFSRFVPSWWKKLSDGLYIMNKVQRQSQWEAVYLMKIRKQQPADGSLAALPPNVMQQLEKDMEVFSGQWSALHDECHNMLTEQLVPFFEQIDEYSHALEEKMSSRRNQKKMEIKSLTEIVGFELEVKPSTIHGAGNGVFVKSGNVYPGTVIALFPGLVYLPEYVMSEQSRAVLTSDQDFFCYIRPDGTMIDSRVTENINHNPYALGHMVNHVPKGGKPNIMQIMYDYMGPLRPDPFPVELQKHIPNRYTKEGTWLGTPDQGPLVRATVCLADRVIREGEELYADYRLRQPAEMLPAWYEPYDPEGQAERYRGKSQ